MTTRRRQAVPQIKDKRVAYRERHAAIGLCRTCRAFALPNHEMCFRHIVIYQIKKARMKPGVLKEHDRKLRELLVVSLLARYHAIMSGVLQPGTEADRLTDAIQIRMRIGMGWGGVRGARKLATLIGSIEGKAMRDRGKDGSD